MNNEFDYYLHFPIMGPSTPAVRQSMEWDSDIDLDLANEEPLGDDFGPLPIVFEFDEPYPKKPDMVDCFYELVVSSKVHSVLESLNIDGIQLFPATIHDPKNKTSYDNYWYPHIHHHIECLDTEKSIYTKDVLDMVHEIKKWC